MATVLRRSHCRLYPHIKCDDEDKRVFFSPTHSLQDNSPVENVIAMYQTAHERVGTTEKKENNKYESELPYAQSLLRRKRNLEDYVQRALELKWKVFSAHAPLPFETEWTLKRKTCPCI